MMTSKIENAPKISCIVTVHNEGKLAAVSLRSLMAQSFTDFEILVVDDGASETTRAVVRSFDDPRIQHIQQANDGPSSARNRALSNARGEYVCFLDADDTRPPWAFAEMVAATENSPDCVFSPGTLIGLRKEILPFYDQTIFERLKAFGYTALSVGDKAFIEALRLLTCVEPQSASKLVKRSFLDKHQIRFPNGVSFFEDSNFHLLILMNMSSFQIMDLPTFTYFRRYGEKRLTDSRSYLRFDAFAAVINVMQYFEKSRYFQDHKCRFLLTAVTFRVLQWGLESVSLDLRYTYEQALKLIVTHMDDRLLRPVPEAEWAELEYYAPWVKPSLQFLQGFKRP